MTPTESLPRALVSAGALRAGALEAAALGGEIADLRGDALGHGVREVAALVKDAGIHAVLVEDAETAERLRDEGVRAVTDGGADIDTATLYGLPGARTAPAMRLVGRVLSTKPLHAGEAVSYGYLHRATADTTVALVTGGYAQGIVRALGNAATVEIDGVMRPIVGRVAMDVCVIDLEDSAADVTEGAEVLYFGGTGAGQNALANWAEITGFEIVELITVAGSKAVRIWTP
ncbi:alanine racemase C-terminal domain-containing protein [Microbacterium murale]|uniref:Alanine racemase n=1 Tax=Microbacterium murale TaxID=1081040 RepID=A0ABU0PF68_9MICO|nr:alanine racemase C-terminal domain-containing protein [Microbacterium murale]MDQ0645577.1 alanine racemase [Microbacterium murale]